MSAEVVIFGGGERIATPGHADPNVVAEIEHLLEMARAGRINGIAYALSYSDAGTGNRYVGVISRAQVGALFAVMGRMSKELDAV